MHRDPATALGALVLAVLPALSSPALAIDFEPLVSQELAGGVYEYDNIFIPAGVTLTLVGEPRQATLRALGDLTLAGSLVAPGWEIRLEAGDQLQVLGNIDVRGGALSATAGGDLVLRGRAPDILSTLIPRTGGVLVLRGDHGGPVIEHDGAGDVAGGVTLVPGITPAAPVPEPETWALLLAGLGLLGWRRWRTPA